MGSSLPNHDAKDQEDRHNRDREKKKKIEKPRADYKLAQKKKNKQFYMMHEHYQYMMHALMQKEQVQLYFKITKLA